MEKISKGRSWQKLSRLIQLISLFRLPRWHSGKESACQCRRCKGCRVNSWARKTTWRRKWQPTPVFLPRKPHGQRSLVGYNPCSSKESNTTEWLNTSLLSYIVLVSSWTNAFYDIYVYWSQSDHDPRHFMTLMYVISSLNIKIFGMTSVSLNKLFPKQDVKVWIFE